MKEIAIFLCMIFCHILDDFKFQGILAEFKSKHWWREHSPSEQYKHDWKISLFMHCFSWSFMVMLPILISLHFTVPVWFIVVFVVNLCVHFVIDHLKANAKMINLVQDQCAHFVQIIWTFMIYIFLQ